MQEQRKRQNPTDDASPDSGKGDAAGLMKAREGRATLAELDAALAMGQPQEKKQKQKKIIRICCCGEPDCNVGPFEYREG